MTKTRFEGVGVQGALWMTKTYQSVTVVNGNRGPGDICDVTSKGAVCLEELTTQYPLRPSSGFGMDGSITVTDIPKAFDLIVPLHHCTWRHQPVVGAQTEVEFLPKGRDVEEKFLVRFTRRKHFPLDTLLVSGRE